MCLETPQHLEFPCQVHQQKRLLLRLLNRPLFLLLRTLTRPPNRPLLLFLLLLLRTLTRPPNLPCNQLRTPLLQREIRIQVTAAGSALFLLHPIQNLLPPHLTNSLPHSTNLRPSSCLRNGCSLSLRELLQLPLPLLSLVWSQNIPSILIRLVLVQPLMWSQIYRLIRLLLILPQPLM